MQLSSQLFDRIVGMSSEAGRPATVLPVGCRRAPERRSMSRLAFGQRTQICRDAGPKAGVWETVLVKDISTQGIGILCDEQIQPGQTFMLKLSDKTGQTIRIRCKTSRCEKGGFGNTSYMLGATFEQVIAQQQLRLNEDERDTQTWQDQTPTTEPAETITGDGNARKSAGTMARVAASLLRAVDPSQWLRRADDYS
jgi:hypothetical protein